MKSRKLININSRDRTSGTDNDFKINIELPSQHRFNRICILGAVIPKTFYTVHQDHNTFTLTEEGTSVQIEIPVANYNRRSLADIVSSAMSIKSPGKYRYHISFPNAAREPDDGKYLFQVFNQNDIPESNLNASITMPGHRDSDMFELLGFDSGSTNAFHTSKLKSKNVVKVQSEDVIRIHCNVCDNSGNDILLELYATTTPTFSNLVWVCPDTLAYSMPLVNKHTSQYEFKLKNEDGHSLNLNGLNYCFQLLLFEE